MRPVGASGRGRGVEISIVGLVLAAVLALLLLGGAAIALVAAGPSQSADVSQISVSALARSEIPPLYLHLYIAAASRYGVDWAILAGIGKVECDHGRDPSPSCTEQGVENAAGAGGPMQFLATTWAQYGVDVGSGGLPDRWDPADAIYSAARYLRACGAPSDYRTAIYAYNHAWWYVQKVEYWAARYRGQDAATEQIAAALEVQPGAGERAISQQASQTPVLYVSGKQAKLLRGDGHVALIPEAAPPGVQAMIVAGNELQELPYGPTGHPDPLGASSEDCSSTVNYVLYRAGVRSLAEILRENPLAQDYVHWGAPGSGRWVSIYATDTPSPHVFMTIAGLRLDTVGGSMDEGPNSAQEGPRWRVLPYIPTWAHWTVHHPPGL